MDELSALYLMSKWTSTWLEIVETRFVRCRTFEWESVGVVRRCGASFSSTDCILLFLSSTESFPSGTLYYNNIFGSATGYRTVSAARAFRVGADFFDRVAGSTAGFLCHVRYTAVLIYSEEFSTIRKFQFWNVKVQLAVQKSGAMKSPSHRECQEWHGCWI